MSTDAMRAALEWYADEAEALAKNTVTGTNTQAVLASVTVLALDGGRKARAALAQPSVSRDAFCWLVELFEGDGSGNSAGWYHTGFTDIGGHARTTKNLHDARRYRTREQAEQVAAKLGHTLTGTWRAVEHGFQVRVQPSVPDKRDALLLLAANCCESIYAPGTWDEDDDRWMIETHCGKFYGQLLTDALTDFWRSALRACDAEGRPTEPDPFAVAQPSVSAEPVEWRAAVGQDSRILHELAGAASLCWVPTPTGVFDTQKAIGFVEAALKELRESAAKPPAQSLSMQMQKMCSEWGTYWRAPDAHGVNLSHEQALELLRFALGVEVEIAAPQPQGVSASTWLPVGLQSYGLD